MDAEDVKLELLGCVVRNAMGIGNRLFIKRLHDDAFLCVPDENVKERDWVLVYCHTKAECITAIVDCDKLGYGWDRETGRT